ncbi:MAG TPA: hypothetical protein VGA34_12585 [Alteraurantiacibacter sp.]
MTIVDAAHEAEELNKIWDSLTGLSIAWEVENKTPWELRMHACKQSKGLRIGSWDDIPAGPGENEECGTQHDTIFGSHNTGGVIYEMAASGFYFGWVWDDPSIGQAEYAWAVGPPDYVEAKIESWWNGFSGMAIKGAKSEWVNTAGVVKIRIQPGFDPFKITIYPKSTAEGELDIQACSGATPRPHDSDSSGDPLTRERLAEKQEIFAKALLDSANRLRKD